MYSRVLTLVVLLLALIAGRAGADQIYGIRDSLLVNNQPRVYSLSVQDLATDGSPARDFLVNLQNVEIPVLPGTFMELACVVGAAPTVPNVWTFTLLKNGATTLIACSVTGNNRSCANDVDQVTVTSGDRVALQVAPSGLPPGAPGACTMIFR
jgi:hypothetical protein